MGARVEAPCRSRIDQEAAHARPALGPPHRHHARLPASAGPGQRHGRGRRRIYDDEAAQREHRLRDRDHLRVLQRRQGPARQLRHPEPAAAQLRRHAAKHQGRGGRGGEPLLLDRPRHLDPRHGPSRVRDRPRRHPAGRLDHHPAVHQDQVPVLRPDGEPEVQGAVPRLQDQPAADQGGDPRGLPQHDLLRPRRVRDPGGEQGVLRRRRQEADRPAGRRAGQRDQQPGCVRPRRRGQHRAAAGALPLRARLHGRDPEDHPGRGRQVRPQAAQVPRRPHQRALRRPQGLPAQDGGARAGRRRLRLLRDQRRRAEDHHHLRPGGAERGREGRRRPTPGRRRTPQVARRPTCTRPSPPST